MSWLELPARIHTSLRILCFLKSAKGMVEVAETGSVTVDFLVGR